MDHVSWVNRENTSDCYEDYAMSAGGGDRVEPVLSGAFEWLSTLDQFNRLFPTQALGRPMHLHQPDGTGH